jgi:quercetin dioxygenase-like cupin family protein
VRFPEGPDVSRFFPTTAECGRHTIFGTIPITTYAGESMQLSVVEMPPGSGIDWHSHANEQMGMVLAGRAVFHIGGEEKALAAGDLYFIPGGVTHRVVASEEGLKALDFFHPIRDEYR